MLKEDTEYSSSEEEATSTYNKEEELEQNGNDIGEHEELNDNQDDDDAEEGEPDEDSDDNDDDLDIDYEGFAFLQEDITYSLQDKPGILAIWILLDSQLMVDVFSINKPLTNIRDSKCTITLYCNARKAIITQKGDLKGYVMLWYYPEGIANILSLSNVKKSTRSHMISL